MADTATTRPRLHLGCGERYLDGYRRVLEALGYGSLEFEHAKCRGTYNVTVEARREGGLRDRDRQYAVAEEILRESLVDESETELRLLAEWSGRLRASA
jgi:hypothetical protein